MTEAIAPGPASIGMAIGNTETSSISGVSLHLLGARLAPLGALVEHHVERDQEQHDPARGAERVRARCAARQQLLAEQREQQQDRPAIRHARTAIERFCAGLAPVVSPA